jgi:16S rRNA (guanine527-N7)-methyltransferase
VTDPRSLLACGLAELGISPAREQRERLVALAELVDRWNARINLTGHRGVAQILRRLVLEAVALATNLPEIESLADVGSGAGFPGLPLAILRPECRVTLIESREKRHLFQRAACRVLDLRNATPMRGRAEDLEPTPHAAVVAQAVAHPESAIAWMLPWARPGGLLILPGGATPPQIVHPRIRLQSTSIYRAPCRGPIRSLWIGRVLS